MATKVAVVLFVAKVGVFSGLTSILANALRSDNKLGDLFLESCFNNLHLWRDIYLFCIHSCLEDLFDNCFLTIHNIDAARWADHTTALEIVNNS